VGAQLAGCVNVHRVGTTGVTPCVVCAGAGGDGSLACINPAAYPLNACGPCSAHCRDMYCPPFKHLSVGAPQSSAAAASAGLQAAPPGKTPRHDAAAAAAAAAMAAIERVRGIAAAAAPAAAAAVGAARGTRHAAPPAAAAYGASSFAEQLRRPHAPTAALATAAAERLVQEALDRGTMDNVTAVVGLMQWD
jgi:hypothetical protein